MSPTPIKATPPPEPVGQTPQPAFRVRNLSAGYPGRPQVLKDLNLDLPAEKFTAVLGPNGCGKSTLLLALSGLIKRTGDIEVLGMDLHRYPGRSLARTLSFLPQTPLAPEGITVRNLVLRGREPHRSLLRPLTGKDTAAAESALVRMHLETLADSPVSELSGGQRQRAWIAMTLAQDTHLLMLDEPTSYLDIAHQVEILSTCSTLAAEGRTVVAVLHDLTLAARFADHIVVMANGKITATGSPSHVLNVEFLTDVFDLPCRVITDPDTGTPVILPSDPRTP